MADGTGDTVLRAANSSLRFIHACGFIADFAVTDSGRRIAPLHRAPWIGEAMPPGAPPHFAELQGDFFCAPFADGGGPGAVSHGAPGNERWEVMATDGRSLSARLAVPVMGARVTKRLALRDGESFVYQVHRFEGGEGQLSAANHAMVSLPSGGRISFSPKAAFRTPATAPEPDPARGRSALAYPASSPDPTQFPRADGSLADLTRYPVGPAHEDFVVAIEAEGNVLGWTAAVRPAEGDLFLSLRNPAQLPMTMLWFSNGGRDYAPWSGRHTGCLGVEEGLAGHMLGEPGAFALAPGRTLDIRHAIGALSWPGGAPVAAVTVEGGALTLTGEDGTSRTVPFDLSHLFP
jgi:hypothetical protein